MKTFELSNKRYKNGKRHFKLILAEVYSSDVVINEVGTKFNDNGCTFLAECCQKNIDSIKGMSLTCEFLDDERTEICGHGETGEFEDGIPLFNNASIIGTFEKGYIEEINVEGDNRNFLIGEGYIDAFRYKPFLNKLEEKISNNETVQGSVEIFRTDNNDEIVYRYGYKEKGRIPEEFIFSGYALLGVRPSDMQAKLLELNKNIESEEKTEMDEKYIALITDSVKQTITEVNSKNAEFENTISELNEKIAEKDNTITELNAKIVELEANKVDSEKTIAEQNSKVTELENEVNAIKTEKAIAEMNDAIKGFSDEEKGYAEAEIKAFKESPLTSEINSIITKIHAGIGAKLLADKAKAEEEKKTLETNAKTDCDIFGDIDDNGSDKTDDGSIFD